MKNKTIILKYFILLLSLIFSGFLAKSQNTAYDYYIKSVESVGSGDYTDALAYIMKSVDKEPNNADYMAYKGYVLRNISNYENSLICMKKAIELNSEVGWYYVEAVVSAYYLKDLVLSKQYCEKAIKFGKESLGEANYNYVVSILDNLKSVEYTLNFQFSPDNKSLIFEEDGTLCIPVPSTDLPYQKSTYKITNATLVKSDKENDFELIYLKPTGKSDVSVLCTITKIPYSYNSEIENYNSKEELTSEIKKYLESSDRFDLNSELIKSTAEKLKSTTDIETINNIINWINSAKTYSAIPPTWTTVDDILKSKTVECATGSLAVIVLARACGIPARQVWGPIDAGRDFSPENYLKGHVWFEFYLPGAGWIPAEQFDKSSIGFLPSSYIRIMTDESHLFDNIPLGNIMTIMHNETYGDIIEYKKSVKN